MSTSTWHAPPDVLARYAAAPAAIDDTTASSIEEHLLACAACRSALAVVAAPADLERSWLAIADAVDRPAPRLVERLLGRLGIAGDTARLVGATGGLQLAWLAVVVLFVALALVAADARGSAWPFLVTAPLLPVGAVSLAFLPVADPVGESGAATPLHGLGVAVRRVLATALPTLVLLGAATPLLPGGRWSSVAWVLPSLALTAAALLLATIVRVPVAVGLSTVTWFGLLLLVRLGQVDVPFERTGAFGAGTQAIAAAVAVAATIGLVVRRDRFTTLEVHW